MKVTFADIVKARENLKSIIKETEVELSHSASEKWGAPIYFKYENLQRTGSFKIRGAYNKILSLSEAEKKRGVVASSAGNHAQGVALSAKLAGVKATIVMPENASLNKISATRGYGAEVVLKGEIYDDAYEHARELEKSQGFAFVHPYEDEKVIAGQGTIGIEILERIPDLDLIAIPIGGGGLISGIATAIKHLRPQCKIIGVQSAQAPGMKELFNHQPISHTTKRISTIADGIAIKRPSPAMYENFISKLVDEVVTVSDDEIAEAIVYLIERAKTVTEGSGAAAMAAMMNRKFKLAAKNCILLCGGNIDLNIIAKVIERGQIQRGRLAQISVVVDDLPGNLSRLTKVIADEKANVLEVHHDRVGQGLYLRETRIDFTLETISREHVEKIKEALKRIGGRILE
jgi:threonine dehydratase